jgi:microcystin-dependent protein
MVGTAVATALAVSDSFLLPVGTIIGYIGVSTAWSNTNSPWLLCDGTAFERSAYPALYTIIGTTYGSSTSSDFKVPDLRGRFLYHANQYSSQYETITTPSTQLSSSINSNLPQHIHTLNSVVNTSGVNPIVKADMSLYSIGSTDDFMTSYGSGPGNQLVPANASVLWLIKAS